MDDIKKGFPLVFVLVFGAGVIKFLLMISAEYLSHPAESYQIPMLVLGFVGMAAAMSFFLHKTGWFAD